MTKLVDTKKKSIEEKYQMKDLREHILTRPDSYIGNVKNVVDELYILEGSKMVKKSVSYNPGLLKLFDEILVNAIDHSVNDPTVTQIKVTVDSDNNEISVFNDGSGIPIELHKEYKIYIPELLFGNLLTSSNYDDTEERTTGGRNGLGGKCTAIFSKNFTVETVDSVSLKKYIQTFSNNLLEKTIPKITNAKSQKSYTKITFQPDLERFGMKKFDADIISLIEKRVYDCAACTRKTVNVFYNGVMIKFKTFEKYVDLYVGNKSEKKRVFQSSGESNQDWEIACCLSETDKMEQVSFVNSICTINGGKHVDYIQNQISKKLFELIQSKNKNLTIKQNYIKEKLFIFLKSTVINPSFSSQTKEFLTTNTKDFGFKFEVSDDFITKLSKCGIVEEIVAFAKHKENRELSKTTDGKKKNKIKVSKLDDANWAGTSKSSQCTLILTEGDSAKTFAISGLSVVGRDKYGVFPLRGKLLNVRDASTKKLMENKEISELKTIIGLQQDKVYKDLNELRYGKIMILTDSDVDGYHIKGLIMNMFHASWPSLMKFPDFITAMKTPIVKATKGKYVKEFYTLSEYNSWKNTSGANSWTIKYYKGLGTSSSAEAKEYFKSLDKNIVNYNWDKKSNESIELAFDKKHADKRKEWIGGYDPNSIIEVAENNVNFTDFVNKELVHFSVSDLSRSIPSIADGLKPSQRKILFYMLKKDITKEIKVSQLAGYISAETSYHHGPASMEGTIIGMAQDFTGANNVNLLEPIGQFGSRLESGKDSASSRYINTKLADITKKLFPKEDYEVLKYLDDDGQSIEPEYYIPIIPMVLVNGSEGIGTGYSSFVPRYNPKDIIKNLNNLMNGLPMIEIHPYYNGFKGTIEASKENSYEIRGVYRVISDTKIEVCELPVGKSTNDYKEFLDSEGMEKTIKDFQNYSTEECVKFVVEFRSPEFLQKIIKSGEIYKEMKLSKTISITNMNLFNSKGVIQKYTSPNEIIEEFYKLRLDFYNKRKEYLLSKYNKEYEILESKIRFIMAIIDERLYVFKKSKAEIEEQLITLIFPRVEKTFRYLTDMPIYSFSKEKIEELVKSKKNIKDSITDLEESDLSDLWIEDLNTMIKLNKNELLK